MIEFKWSKVDKKHNNTPVISDKEIEEFAELILADYKPKLLQEPGKIRYEHFLESYLGATIEYHDIYNEDPEKPIWGATAFNEEWLRVFNQEKKCISQIKVQPRTVIIDNYVTANGKEGLALFTGLHEAGHLWMHEGVYSNGNIDQMCLFEVGLSPVVCCRSDNIENFGRIYTRNRTPEEWREHHADYFAASIAMPRRVFCPAVRQMLKENGITGKHIVLGDEYELDYIADTVLPMQISEQFGVSKKAALVRLKKCGFVVDQATYQASRKQMAFI